MNQTAEQAKWTEVLSEVRELVSEVSFNTWIAPLTPIRMDESGDTLTLACVDAFRTNLIRQRYTRELEKAISKVHGRKFTVHIEHKSEQELSDIVSGKAEKRKQFLIPSSEDALKEEYYLNPRYTFDNFIVGKNNNYAQAVCLAVAESPADTYNPLFIYGGSGLGKTHLMHAIGNYIQEHDPSKKVLYVSSEMFTNELIAALNDPRKKNSRLNFFKEKYRSVDVLLIDDIQFIEGKESTQEEFFHTFNTLYEFQKQIVISSDRHPSKLTSLDERLTSRFQWNIIADIQPPDFETRVAILRMKAEEEGVIIDEDLMQVMDLIAEKVKFNIRELESALTRVISFSRIQEDKPKITVEFAKSKLPDILSSRDSSITCETIKSAVSKKYGIKISDMESSKRKREFTHPRQVAMYLCRELTEMSLPRIGSAFGGKDHTTVLHACNKIAGEMKTSSILAEEIRAIKEELQ